MARTEPRDPEAVGASAQDDFAALRAAEERSRALIELLPSVTYVMEPVDAGERVVYLSRQAEELLGYPLRRMIDEPGFWEHAVHPDDLDRVSREWLEANRTGEPYTMRYRYIAADGHIVWVRDAGTLIRDHQGRPLHWLGVVVDISDREAVEEELRRREAILHAVTVAAERLMLAASWTEHAEDILSALGRAARVSRVYVFQNRTTDGGRLVADQRAEWVADAISAQFDNASLQGFDYLAEGYGPWAERMREGEAVQARAVELEGRPRELFAEQDILALLLVPVFTDSGWWGFIGFDECVEDRTFPPVEVEALRAAAGIFGAAIGRERAQEALIEVETRFRALVEQLPAVTHISGLDRNASTIYISPQVEQVLGYGPSEWLADPDLWVELLHEDDRDAAIAGNEEFLRTGEPFRMEYRMRARDGRVVWIRDESVMIRDADGQPVEMQGIMLDVTDTRRAKEELQRSLTLLERSDAERRDLLAHLVHAQEQERVRIASDIHDDPLQKLTAVGMRLAGLRRELGESRSDALLQLERTISGAISSLRSLLFEVRPPSLDREGLAIALSQYLRETCGPSELGWELDDQLVVEPPSEVRAICYRIAQEALTNVRKHAHASTVRVELSSSDEGVRVRVLDDGIGIDLDAPGSGVGHLGIPSMRERAELAGGGLRIATPPDGGTAVEFRIPSLPPDAGTDSS